MKETHTLDVFLILGTGEIHIFVLNKILFNWGCKLVGFKNRSRCKCKFFEMNSKRLPLPWLLCFIEFNLNENFYLSMSISV